MGGCQHPCSGDHQGKRVRWCGPETCGEMYQVVEHSLKFLDFVAIGSHAVLSFLQLESTGGISRGE